jgi:hypothetical protein
MVWPWPSEAVRFLYVIAPILLGYGICMAQLVSNRVDQSARWAIRFAVPVLLTVTILPNLFICVHRRFQEVPPDMTVIKHIAPYYSDFPQDRSLAVAMAQLLTNLPLLAQYVSPSDCIFQIKPSVVMLLAERPAYLPPPPSATDDEFSRGLRQCRYAYLVKGQSVTFPSAFYPRDRLHGEYRILTTLPDKMAPDGEALAELIDLLPTGPRPK